MSLRDAFSRSFHTLFTRVYFAHCCVVKCAWFCCISAAVATGVLMSKLDPSAFPQWQPATPLSRAEIDAMRNEYWHTRVTGAAEIWTTLRAAAEAVLNGDVELANAILEVLRALGCWSRFCWLCEM
jgi:hypothetical protein